MDTERALKIVETYDENAVNELYKEITSKEINGNITDIFSPPQLAPLVMLKLKIDSIPKYVDGKKVNSNTIDYIFKYENNIYNFKQYLLKNSF